MKLAHCYDPVGPPLPTVAAAHAAQEPAATNTYLQAAGEGALQMRDRTAVVLKRRESLRIDATRAHDGVAAHLELYVAAVIAVKAVTAVTAVTPPLTLDGAPRIMDIQCAGYIPTSKSAPPASSGLRRRCIPLRTSLHTVTYLVTNVEYLNT